MLMEIKKRVLLEDEASDWLQLRLAASSVDVKVTKLFFFSLTRRFSQMQSYFKSPW